MPFISSSTYTIPNRLWRNAHVQTIVPSLIRRLRPVSYKRQRLELADGDFLDLDWCNSHPIVKKRVVIICHGLEGASNAPYVKGMAHYFKTQGWHVLAMNFRSCSGELNRLARSYHSGETADLGYVLECIAEEYDEIALVGFSLSGNAILKYLGEQGSAVSLKLIGAVVFSVPCDLAGSGDSLKKPDNKLYMKRFLRMLEKKVRAKHLRGDEIASPDSIKQMSSFWEFDDAFTAPIHGFAGADDYYQQSSSLQYLERIRLPTLMINAQNDPFLSPLCFPEEQAKQSQYFYFEKTIDGGHCGFPSGILFDKQWHEVRAIEFLTSI